MLYSEALEAAKKIKPATGFIRLSLGYNLTLLIPHAQGMAVLAALDTAETLEEPYNKPPVIRGLRTSDITVGLASSEEVLRYRMAQLLNVPLDDLAHLKDQENPPF